MASSAQPSPGNENRLYQPSFRQDWERHKLYSLAQWVNGLAFRDIQFSPTGKPVIKIAEIKQGLSDQTKYTKQVFDESVHIKKGDLLFTWSGQPETSIDVFWWRGLDGWLNQHSFRVTPTEGVDPVFLYYLLRYLKPNFIGIARNKQTTGLGHVTKRDLENIEVAYPRFSEQRAIARVLGTLDDKIELNRRMNETLETMARALFKSWFIDFDPVHAKAEGRDPGLPADIAALFPSSFEDSELGEIPKGWTVAPMGHLAEVTIGGDWGEDNPLADSVEAVCLRGVDLEHLRENGWADAPRRWFTTLSIQKRTLCARDVLVAGSGAGPTGRSLWAAPELDQLWGVPVLYSNFCKRLRCPSEASAIYLDRSLSIMRDSGEIWEYVNGTSVPNLDAGALLSGKMLVLPDGAILDAFARLIKEISAHLFSPESRTLATVRDTLLPKLLSGELQVKDVDQPMEAHV